MPYDVPIPPVLRKSGWRAAVYDSEGPEIPHVTIRFKTDKTWKVSLRDGGFRSRRAADGGTFRPRSRPLSKTRRR